MMFRVLGISRSSYYRWIKNSINKREQKQMELSREIKDAYFEVKGRNSSSRLAKDLQASGVNISRTTVAYCTVITVVRMAYRSRSFKEEMIFHSYRGILYACKQTVNLLQYYRVVQSMSGKGNCWDNVVAESLFKSFKTDLIYGTKLKTKEQMRLDVFEYIESWYNHKRRFSALVNLTIDKFWEQYNIKKQLIKNVA